MHANNPLYNSTAARNTVYFPSCEDGFTDEDFNRCISTISELQGTFLVIVEIEMWCGTEYAIATGNHDYLSRLMLTDYDLEVFTDNKDLCMHHIHHDGCNTILIRRLKPCATRRRIKNLAQRIKNGTATRAQLNTITSSVRTDFKRLYFSDSEGV